MENLPISTVTLFALKDFDCQADIEMFNFDEVSFIRGADNLDAEYFNENIIKLIGQLNLMSFSNKFFSVSKRDILSIETMGEEHIRLKRKSNSFY